MSTPSRPEPTELVAVDLTDDERSFLERALVEWGGAARCTDAMAIAMGFSGVHDFVAHAYRFSDAMRADIPLSRWDWTRSLFAAEVILASDAVGLGHIWTDVTGLDDLESWTTLRAIQRKMVDVTLPIDPAP